MEHWRLEALLRSRRLRLALGLLIGAGGLWAFAPYVLMDVATQAAVNAPLIRVSAPADGTVGALPPVGSAVGGAHPLKLVEVAIDAGALGQANAQAARAESLAILLRRQIAEIEQDEARLEHRADVFETAARARLSADVTGARALAQSCTSQVREADAVLQRAERLLSSGFVTPAAVDKARAGADRARADCRAAQARAGAAGAESRAAASGVLLADGANDQPYSAQQLDRLGLERRQLEARLLEAEALATAERQRIADAQHRAEPKLPAGLLVWRVWASPGAAVTAGAGLMDLADCRRRFVEMALPERRADAVRPGDEARVRLVGTDEWMVGRVTRVTGSAAVADESFRAARPQARAEGREISVEVSLPPAPAVAARGCDIGRLAEVRLGRRLG